MTVGHATEADVARPIVGAALGRGVGGSFTTNVKSEKWRVVPQCSKRASSSSSPLRLLTFSSTHAHESLAAEYDARHTVRPA